jgi:hypothetical protein
MREVERSAVLYVVARLLVWIIKKKMNYWSKNIPLANIFLESPQYQFSHRGNLSANNEVIREQSRLVDQSTLFTEHALL